MRARQSSEIDLAQERTTGKARSTGRDLERKFWVALALYGCLALLVWFTMDAGKVSVFGRPVDLRLVPLIVIGALALRTVVARQAEKVRRGEEKNSS